MTMQKARNSEMKIGFYEVLYLHMEYKLKNNLMQS